MHGGLEAVPSRVGIEASVEVARWARIGRIEERKRR